MFLYSWGNKSMFSSQLHSSLWVDNSLLQWLIVQLNQLNWFFAIHLDCRDAEGSERAYPMNSPEAVMNVACPFQPWSCYKITSVWHKHAATLTPGNFTGKYLHFISKWCYPFFLKLDAYFIHVFLKSSF